MANIVNKAQIKQRSLVITLLDLKNAFGEVHHNLLHKVLNYRYIPDHIKALIQSLYTYFSTSVITSEFNTPFIRVGIGVLQADCLSPMLFGMCCNTFIQHIKVGRFLQFGFFEKPVLVHWFQFADDAALISGQESSSIKLTQCKTVLRNALKSSSKKQLEIFGKTPVLIPMYSMTSIEILKKLLSQLEMTMKINFQTYSYPKAISLPTETSIRFTVS